MFAAIFCLALAALADHANVRAHHAQTTASDAAGPAADLNAQRIRVEGENLLALELEGSARDIRDPRQEGPMAVRAEARVGHDEVGAEDWVAVPGSLTWFPTSSTLRLVLNVEESDASEVHTVSQVEIELQEDADMKHTGRQRLFWRGRVRGIPKSRATAHIHRKRKKVSGHPAMETDLHPGGSFPAPDKCALRDSNVSHIHGVISVNGVVRSYEATRVHEDNGEDRNNCEELSSGWEFRVRALEDGAREIFHRRLGESKEGNEDGYFADKESKLTDEWDDCYPGMSTMKEMKAVVMADVGYRNIFESDGEAEDEIIGTFYDSSTLIYEPQLNIRLIADHIIIGGTDDK